MIIACPQCRQKLRIDPDRYAAKSLSLTCRNCNRQFPFTAPSVPKILVAHGEPDVCRSVLEICAEDSGKILTCVDAASARQLLACNRFSVLLLDVALPGAYPFQLIEELRRAGESLKIVLLPSVYNRTAYKRTPSSLYGADAYLELHHLSDRLIPLLHELAPQLVLKSRPYCLMADEGQERALSPDADFREQAEELARMLIADIALYHQELIDAGIVCRDLEIRLAAQLDEGRRMLACRIPQVELDRQDYLLTALTQFAAEREKELQAGTKK